MTPLERIRQLYYETSKTTIADDFDEAIRLLKSMPSEEERETAAVFMDGLAQMRSEWQIAPKRHSRPPRRP
jgi:hypothetical protein